MLTVEAAGAVMEHLSFNFYCRRFVLTVRLSLAHPKTSSFYPFHRSTRNENVELYVLMSPAMIYVYIDG